MIDKKVLRVVEALEEFQRQQSDAWNIPRDEGLLLHSLVLAAGCRRLVEVGTSYGFSGLFLSSAAKANGGTLDTFDIDPRKVELARQRFEQAGLGKVTHVHLADILTSTAKLAGGIDFAFLDAVKQDTIAYFQALEPKFAPRCLVAVDNTMTHAQELRGFVEWLCARGDFTCCNVPAGNGFELAVRTK